MDKDFSLSEVQGVITSLGNGKAAGWDEIPNEALKNSTPSVLKMIVVLMNRVKNSGIVPKSWKKGRLVLIHKKGPTTDVGNYRPLTVLESLTGLYTKLLNKRLVSVVEEHKLLGEVQNGFRKTRSGADCGFILNTVLWKTAAQRKKVHLAFLDLQKAYDSVDRVTLWRRLAALGFKGKFLATLQVMLVLCVCACVLISLSQQTCLPACLLV